MLYLVKKMIRDLWNMKAQFIAVLLMAFFAVFMYVGQEGVWYGMLDYANEWFEKSDTADAWVLGYNLQNDDVKAILNMEDIEIMQAVSSVTGEMKCGSNNAQIFLMASNKNELSMPTVTKGSEYIPTSNGIWIYETFAEENELDIGDLINIEYDGNALSLKICGLVLSPEYLSYTGSSTAVKPDHTQYGYGYISPNNMKILMGGELAYNQLKIKYRDRWNEDKKDFEPLDDKEVDEARLDIEQKLGYKYVGYSDRSNFKGISAFIDKLHQLRNMTVLFTVLLTLLAMLTMQTTMKRMIEVQRIQIGTLKAIGYQNWKIRMHFLLYGFCVSLIGGLAGLIIAPLTISQVLLELQKKFFSSPKWNVSNSWVSVALFIGVVLICSITALMSSRKGTKDMPAITMRDEPPKTKKAILLERFTGIWEFLSYEWRWTFRVIAHNKARTAIGIIGIVGSVTLLVDSFGLYDSLQYANRNLYGTQYDYGARITLKEIANEDDKAELFELAHENAQWVQENAIDIRSSQDRTNSIIQVYDDGYFYHFEDKNGEIVALPSDGIAISHKLAKDLGVQANDIVQFRVAGQKKYITATIREIINPAAPQGIFLSVSYWDELCRDFTPNVLLVKDSDIAEKIAEKSYISEVITLDEQLKQADEVVSSVLVVIIMLFVGSLLLSIIILYNLGILSFTERSREYATLKVIGYKDGEIKSFIRHDNLFQLVIGMVLGIPAGYTFLKFHIGLASTSSIEYTAHLNPLHLITSLAIVAITTLFVSHMVSRRALGLNMVESLKAVE